MTPPIKGIDHVAVTVNDLGLSIAFDCDKLGAQVVNELERGGKVAMVQLHLGGAMVNVHRTEHGHRLVAAKPAPGAVDLCFRWAGGVASAKAGVSIVEGPVAREASDGKQGQSVYFRDLDGSARIPVDGLRRDYPGMTPTVAGPSSPLVPEIAAQRFR